MPSEAWNEKEVMEIIDKAWKKGHEKAYRNAWEKAYDIGYRAGIEMSKEAIKDAIDKEYRLLKKVSKSLES